MARSELAAGIDLGGTNMTVGIVDRKGRIHGRARKKTKAFEGRDSVLERIESAVSAACEDAKVRPADLAAVGIGAPGPVDFGRGVVLASGNLGWKNVALGELLRKRLGVPVYVDNDANVAAWGEATVGAGQGCGSLLAVWVGTGVGAGIVVNDAVWRGDLHTAGEFGHVIAYAGGQAGSRTIEDFCSRTGVVRTLTTLAGLHPDSAFHAALARHAADGKAGPLGSGAIAACYEAGDPLVCDVVHAAADLLGLSIANWVTMMSMRTVVLGGGLTEAIGKPWVDRVESAMRARIFPQAIAGKASVRLTKLRDEAGVLGAAMLAWDALG
ncbi:MAG: ROK family protein [Phycisphaerales bacterium]|nr:ROK family protein [Phycisphaerales bacterium]